MWYPRPVEEFSDQVDEYFTQKLEEHDKIISAVNNDNGPAYHRLWGAYNALKEAYQDLFGLDWEHIKAVRQQYEIEKAEAEKKRS